MKTNKRVVALVGIGMLFALLADGTSGCGAVGGASSSGGGGVETSTSLSDAAGALLAVGDIAGAQAKYDASLAADPDNATAAFGAAMTRMMSLPASEPSSKVLRSLGQIEFKTANMVGPTGYLNELNEFNKAAVSLDSLSGQFFGTITPYNTKPDSYTTTDPVTGTTTDVECVSRDVYGHFRSDDGKTQLAISLTVQEQTKINGTITSSLLLQPGDVINVQRKSDHTECFYGNSIVSVGVYGGDLWYASTLPSSTGSVLIKSVGSNPGDPVEIELQNVVLTGGISTPPLTLNGTIADTVTGEDVDSSKYVPFGKVKGGKGANHILNKTIDGYTADRAMEDVTGYHPLLDDIVALLDRADRNDDFQFTFPKGLYFGSKDVTVNRIDLKSILAAMHFFQAGLYLAESWSYPIDLGTLFDEQGNRIISPEDLVGQLNQFFTLRDDHHLDQAQLELTLGFQTILEAHDLFSTVTKDGVFEAVPGLDGAYAQLRDAVAIAQASLNEAQVFTYVEPNLTIDMNHFFNHPPDARNVDVDPFVLENGKIKFVEAFFKKMTEGVIDVDLTRKYQHAFTAVKKDPFLKGVFDEFDVFFIAGHFFSAGGSN